MGEQAGDWIINRPGNIVKLVRTDDLAGRIHRTRAWLYAALPDADPIAVESHLTNLDFLTRRDFDIMMRRMEYVALTGFNCETSFAPSLWANKAHFEQFYPGFSKWFVLLESIRR